MLGVDGRIARQWGYLLCELGSWVESPMVVVHQVLVSGVRGLGLSVAESGVPVSLRLKSSDDTSWECASGNASSETSTKSRNSRVAGFASGGVGWGWLRERISLKVERERQTSSSSQRDVSSRDFSFSFSSLTWQILILCEGTEVSEGNLAQS